MKVLIVGSSGLVGRHLLKLALAEQRVREVVAPVRRAIDEHPKLLAPLVDFENLPEDAPWWSVNAVICTLGTTMRAAGSRAAFRRVDYDYPLAVARLSRRHGATTFVLNSAIGANASSRFFYNRVKGELERGLANIGFRSLTYVRPGLIGGRREEFRAGERAAVLALKLLGVALPRRWRLNPAERIAQSLLESAIDAKPGIHITTSENLT